MSQKQRINFVSKKSKGFTIVEIIVALAVLSILAAIALPAYTNYISQARATICYSHRGSIARTYQFQKAIDRTITFSAVANEYTCPSKGVYSLDNNNVVTCSVHGSGGEITEDEDVGFTIRGDDGNVLVLRGTVTYASIKEALASNGSVSIAPGTVIIDSTGTYIFKGPANSISYPNFSENMTLQDIKNHQLSIGSSSLVSVGIEGTSTDADIYDYYYNEEYYNNKNPGGFWNGLSYDEMVSYNGKLYLTLRQVTDPKILPPNPTYYLEIIQ